MGPADALHLLRRRWLVLATVVLLCLLVGAGLTARVEKKYQATAQLFVSVVLPNDPAGLAAANIFTTARVQSYVSLASAPDVTDYVVRELGLPISSAGLSREVTANAPANRLLVNIGVTDASPERVARIANAVAARFIIVVEGLERTQSGAASPVRITLTRPASQPQAPVSPRPKLNLALSLLAGLLLGVAAMRLRDRYGDGLSDLDEVESLAACPVLGVVPAVPRRHRAGPQLGQSRSGLAARAFGVAAGNLDIIGLDHPPRQFAVTSASRGEGKTTVVLQLGAALAARGADVCLIDANLRSPALTRRLGVPGSSGLTRALLGLDSHDGLAQGVAPGLWVVDAGPVPPNPTQVLESTRAEKIIDELAMPFGYTLVDAGPVLVHDDGTRAAVLVAATIVVVRARTTRASDLVTAVGRLRAAGADPIGLVVVRASSRQVKHFLQDRHVDELTSRPVRS